MLKWEYGLVDRISPSPEIVGAYHENGGGYAAPEMGIFPSVRRGSLRKVSSPISVERKSASILLNRKKESVKIREQISAVKALPDQIRWTLHLAISALVVALIALAMGVRRAH